MDAPQAIAFARRDAGHGVGWLRHSGAMFRVHPLAWLVLLFTYYALFALAELGPWGVVGQFVAPLLKPVFAVGFLAAAWTQERGGAPRFPMLFRGFRSNLFALLVLGAVFFAGISAAALVVTLIDGGAMARAMTAPPDALPDALRDRRLWLASLVGALCALPTILALWFAPALVVFQDAGPLRALAVSLRASLANWRAMLAYGLAVLTLGGVLPLAAMFVARLFGETAAGVFMLFAVMPYLFAFVATLQIVDYVSYRDVFHADVALAPQASPRGQP